MTCQQQSRGSTTCRLDQDHDGLHTDHTLLWDDDGYLCNHDGTRI